MIRFFRRIKIMPGLRLNISKSGVSASVGPRGAHMTVGPHGGSLYAGLPGTGLSMREHLQSPPNVPPPSSAWDDDERVGCFRSIVGGLLWVAAILITAGVIIHG